MLNNERRQWGIPSSESGFYRAPQSCYVLQRYTRADDAKSRSPNSTRCRREARQKLLSLIWTSIITASCAFSVSGRHTNTTPGTQNNPSALVLSDQKKKSQRRVYLLCRFSNISKLPQIQLQIELIPAGRPAVTAHAPCRGVSRDVAASQAACMGMLRCVVEATATLLAVLTKETCTFSTPNWTKDRKNWFCHVKSS